MARCFSKITKNQWFSPSYIMSRTYQHDLRHWIPNTMNTCEFSITWRWYTKIESTHQILCIKIKIPTLKEKIPHAEKLSRAEFGTFSSLLSVKKNCVTEFSQNFDSKSHILVWEANRQNHQIMQKTACHMTIWKDHKNRTIWSIFLLKKCLQAQNLICGYKLSLNHERSGLWGKSTFVKFRNCIGSAKFGWNGWVKRLSMDDVIP